MSTKRNPGDLVLDFADRMGWRFARCNVMLEGLHDERYFQFANELYCKNHRRNLIDDEFSVFAVGLGDKGGTRSIIGKFQSLRDVLSVDSVLADGRPIRVVTLVDDDRAGRDLSRALVRYGFVKNADVFLLHRHFPADTRDVRQFSKRLAEQNHAWQGMDCEVEDLLDHALLQLFHQDHPQLVNGEPDVRDDGHHYELTRDGKRELQAYTRRLAGLAEMTRFIGVLKAFRFLLGCDPSGSPV